MWFGLPAEIAVRCEHCGEPDWRTPVELKSRRLVCFMCNRVSALPPEVAARLAAPEETATSGVFEMARRLATLQPPARAVPRGGSGSLREPPPASGYERFESGFGDPPDADDQEPPAG